MYALTRCGGGGASFCDLSRPSIFSDCPYFKKILAEVGDLKDFKKIRKEVKDFKRFNGIFCAAFKKIKKISQRILKYCKEVDFRRFRNIIKVREF